MAIRNAFRLICQLYDLLQTEVKNDYTENNSDGGFRTMVFWSRPEYRRKNKLSIKKIESKLQELCTPNGAPFRLRKVGVGIYRVEIHIPNKYDESNIELLESILNANDGAVRRILTNIFENYYTFSKRYDELIPLLGDALLDGGFDNDWIIKKCHQGSDEGFRFFVPPRS